MAGKYLRHCRLGSAARGILLIFLVLAVVWTVGLMRFASGVSTAAEPASATTDAIVVLTGGRGRMEAGFDLLSDGRAYNLFISGVFPGTSTRKLQEMFQKKTTYLEDDQIDVGAAINTAGNAAETADWMRSRGFTSLTLVTSWYHMPRSLLEFRHALPEVTLVPYPVFSEHAKPERWWAWPGAAKLVIGEYGKFLLVWLQYKAVQFFWAPPGKKA